MLQKLKVFPQFFLVMLAGVFILPLYATASEAIEPLYQTAQVLQIPTKRGPLGGLTGKQVDMLSDVDKYRARCRPTLEQSLEELTAIIREFQDSIGIPLGEAQRCESDIQNRWDPLPCNGPSCDEVGGENERMMNRHRANLFSCLKDLPRDIENANNAISLAPILDTIAEACDIETSQEKNVKGAIQQGKDDIESFHLRRRLNELQNR
jgi:hypothetical protein